MLQRSATFFAKPASVYRWLTPSRLLSYRYNRAGTRRIGSYVLTMASFVSLVVLLPGLSIGLAQGPDLTPIAYLPGDDQIYPAAGDQGEPDMAIGSQSYLFVWEDSRTDLNNNYLGNQSEVDIYGARVSFDGVLLDSIPIIISQEANEQTDPEVCWNGENWLVVWQSLDINPAQTYYSVHIHAARVSPEGELLDDPPIEVHVYPWSGSATFTASGAGANWVVLSQGSSSGESDIVGFRISPDGEVLDPNGVLILSAAYYQRYYFNLAFAQDEIFFVWIGSSVIRGFRLTPELTPIQSPFRISPEGGYDKRRPTLATNGTDFLVGWEDYLQGWYSNPMVARVSHDGEVLDPDGIELAVMSGAGNTPRLAWDGTYWFAAWGDLYIARVDMDGNVLDYGGVHFPDLKVEEAAARVDGGIQVTYRDGQHTLPLPWDIFRGSISADMEAEGPECISLGTPSQVQSRFAGDGDGWMGIYLSRISHENRVMIQPLNGDGTPLTSEPIQLAGNPHVDFPSIAFDGSIYFAVWHDGSDNWIYGLRILPDGTPLDDAPLAIMPGYEADVEALSDIFGVVGIYRTWSSEVIIPFLVRVSGVDGSILDPEPVSLGGSFAQEPKVTVFGDEWLAVWKRHFSHDNPDNEVMGALIGRDGVPSEPFSVIWGSKRYWPEASGGLDTALIVWHDKVGETNFNLFGKRLLPGGELLDGSGFDISFAPEHQENSAIGWDGTQFVTLFEDRRNRTYFFDLRTDIYGARVTASAEVLDPEGFVFANAGTPEIDPSIAGSDDYSLLAASVFRGHPEHAAYRVGIRFLGGQLPQEIPTLSQWGYLVLALLMVAGGTIAVVRRDRVVETAE